ncbi:MAG TPA: GNAT family N-acetyltransferase [Dongiaceae bacterium]|nr:GNAT family N-acetyltransferase [Dongiaceae bacterium]
MKGAEDILLRATLPADLPEISALVAGLVPRHIGGTASAEGLRHLRSYMAPGAIGARLAGVVHPARNPALVACAGRRIVGYGAVRDDTHVSQVYVAEDWHRRGIGSALLRALVRAIRARHPAAVAVTLNATPRAVEFYLRLGFAPLGPWENWRTGVSLPMALPHARFGSAG